MFFNPCSQTYINNIYIKVLKVMQHKVAHLILSVRERVKMVIKNSYDDHFISGPLVEKDKKKTVL